jgi:hypothetical protein
MYTLEYGVMMLEVIFFSESLPLFLPTLLMVRPFWTVITIVEQFGNGH